MPVCAGAGVSSSRVCLLLRTNGAVIRDEQRPFSLLFVPSATAAEWRIFMKKSNIILTGFMGVGKTEVGKRLAELLGMNFIDTDEAVEAEVGMKISEIFDNYGEERFRREEAAVIRKTAAHNRCVIGTGGGVVLNPENIRTLRKNGIIILLTAQPSVIADRVSKTGERPLLMADNVNSRIREIMSERESYYQDCDYQVDTSEMSIDQVAERIILLLYKN